MLSHIQPSAPELVSLHDESVVCEVLVDGEVDPLEARHLHDVEAAVVVHQVIAEVGHHL